MEDKKEDLRIRRTHKLLCDAMFSLLETKSFDEISVVNICDKAMVHRATFYKHFKDKYAFMEYVTKEKIREFYDKSVTLENYSSPMELCHALIANVTDFIEENKNMLKISAISSNSNLFDSIQNIIFEELLKFLVYAEEQGFVFYVPTDIIAQFLTGGFISLVRWWIADNHQYTKEQLNYYVEMLISQSDKCYEEK